MYRLHKVQKFNKINRTDLKGINLAIGAAEKSLFSSSKRLGTCFFREKKLYCRGKPV